MKQLFSAVAIALFVSAAYLIISPKVSAQCTTAYGGSVTCPAVNLVINKQVENPQTGAFVDNLDNPKFTPAPSSKDLVTYRLIITNTSGSNIARVTVRDVFPQFINFVSGPGNFDNNTKTLTFELTSLTVGESRTFTVQGRIVPDNQIPSDIGIVCDARTTNTTTATADSGPSASDNARVCIERQVLGGKVVITPAKITEVPATGINVLQLLALVPTALVGLTIRRAAIAQKAL